MSRHISIAPVVLAAALIGWLFLSGEVLASGISTADAVVPGGYVPGDFVPSGTSTTFQNASAALGPINGDTGFGGVNPFNPPFSNGQIVAVGAGGSLTVHLSNPVPATGRTLGVFANNGIIDTSSDGSGQAGNPVGTFSPPSRAIVSVSYDGQSFTTLNGGAPITFDNPTNDYLDQPIVNSFQSLGSQTAFQQKPFLGSLGSLNGQSYAQMKTTLNGSAGGTWIDTTAAGIPAVNYVRFQVPTGSSDRMVVDSVGGMTSAEPIAAGKPVIFESVGAGANTSHVVVDFGPQSFEFAVHYDGGITGEQALQLLQDNSLFRFNTQTFGFGDLVSEQDYGGFDFAGTGNNGNDYWSYYTGDGASWSFATQGAGQRTLSDGSFDGWVWTANQTTPPDFPIAVPEPAGMVVLVLCVGLMRRARAVVHKR